MKRIIFSIFIALAFFSGCKNREGVKVFEDIRYNKESDTYIFKVVKDKNMFAELYPKNAVCRISNIDISKGDFSVVGKKDSCDKMFYQNGVEIGVCEVPNREAKASITFAIIDSEDRLGNPNEPLAGGTIPLFCSR